MSAFRFVSEKKKSFMVMTLNDLKILSYFTFLEWFKIKLWISYHVPGLNWDILSAADCERQENIYFSLLD